MLNQRRRFFPVEYSDDSLVFLHQEWKSETGIQGTNEKESFPLDHPSLVLFKGDWADTTPVVKGREKAGNHKPGIGQDAEAAIFHRAVKRKQ